VRVRNGLKGVPDHFRRLHYTSYMENINDATASLERDEALEVFNSNDAHQQAVYNRLAEACDPNVLRKDILRWTIYDSVPFAKVASP
jgi:hypothetical protein